MVALGGVGPLRFPIQKTPKSSGLELGSWEVGVSRVGRFPTGMPTRIVFFKKNTHTHTEKMITDLQT